MIVPHSTLLWYLNLAGTEPHAFFLVVRGEQDPVAVLEDRLEGVVFIPIPNVQVSSRQAVILMWVSTVPTGDLPLLLSHGPHDF